MNLHLAEVAQAVAPGAHGVMLMDRAGWHRAKDLVVPNNLTLVLLPARAPELNPVENIWQFLRDNWLSSRVFASCRDIVDHCCDAWNRLIDQPWLIMSIGLRDWANARSSARVGISRLKLGRVAEQVDGPDPIRHSQVGRGVPAGAVEPEHDDAIPSRPGLTGKQRQ